MELSPALIDDYAQCWRRMEPNDPMELRRLALRLERGRPIYERVAQSTGVPWWIVSVLHYREQSGDMGMPGEAGKFKAYLGNGEPLDRVTVLVPKGRGPFSSWEEGAIDALGLKASLIQECKTAGPDPWRYAEVCAFFFESWNGMGYRMYHPETPSEYLWAFSNVHCRGKYTADGQWDPAARTRQHGAMVLVSGLAAANLIPARGTMDLPAEPRPEGWYERVILQQALNRITPRLERLKVDGKIGPDPTVSPTRRRLAQVGLVMADQTLDVKV